MTLGHLSTDENIAQAGQLIIEEISREYERVNR